MDNYKIIDSKELNFKELSFVNRINSNSANVFINKETNEYFIYPQKGSKSLILENKLSLDSLVENRKYPLLDENISLYLTFQDTLLSSINDVGRKKMAIDFLLKTLDIKEVTVNNEFLIDIDKKFNLLNEQEKIEMFPYLLIFFGSHIQEKVKINWDFETEEFLIPYKIPFLYDDDLNISLSNLNDQLLNKVTNFSNKTFKDIVINIYCEYFNKKFLSTSQDNYFIAKEYKKLLKKDFDSYYLFPFIDIWKL